MKKLNINTEVNKVCNKVANTPGKNWAKLHGDTQVDHRTLKEVRLEVLYREMGWK